MKKCKFENLIILFIIILFASKANAGGIIKVNQLGGGDYLTISEAIDAAFDGDTIKVDEGEYKEMVCIDKNVTIVGSGPDTTIISGPGTNSTIVILSNMRVTVVGFTITNGTYGVFLLGGCEATLKNNIIVGNANGGVYGNGGGIRLTAANCTVTSNAGNGFCFDHDGGGDPTITIYNCIITNNAKYAIWLYHINLNYSFNNIWNNPSGEVYYNSSSSVTSFNNYSVNPLFVDQTTGDYHLRSDSPCLNAGRPVASDNDPDGTRNNLGAYGGPDAAPFWPHPNKGPVIVDIHVSGTSVPQGESITVRATGKIR